MSEKEQIKLRKGCVHFLIGMLMSLPQYRKLDYNSAGEAIEDMLKKRFEGVEL